MDENEDVIFVGQGHSDSGASDPILCDSEIEGSDCDFDNCQCADKRCTKTSDPKNMNEPEVIDLDAPKKASMSYLETDSISNISKVSPTIKTEIKTIADHRKVLKRKPEDEPQLRKRGRRTNSQKTERGSTTGTSKSNAINEQELEEFLVKNVKSAYSRGDIVWAKINGYSFWPAMIDDDPDINMSFWSDDFSTTPTHYHVVFFDAKNRLSRSWCKPNQIKPYGTGKVNISEKHYNAYKVRFRESVRQADEAMNVSVAERIKRWSFMSRKKKPGTQLCHD